jgi:nucleotide-binding universal stress UspA family protein
VDSLDTLTDEERHALLLSPFQVLAHVGGADGKVDQKEREALLSGLRGLKVEGIAAALFRSALDNFESFVERALAQPGLDPLRAAAAILDSRFEPAEAEAVKDALIQLGERVADASGGIFGLGSRISGEEKVALREVGRALRRHSRRSLMAGRPSFSSILVPLDGTHHSEAALKPAAEIADRFGAKVTVLQVATSLEEISQMVALDGFVTPTAVEVMVEAEEAERREASAYLQTVCAAVGGKDWSAVVREGHAPTVILEEAERVGADLIVLASEGRSVIGRIFDPSVGEYVVRHAKVPVLLIPIGHD